MAKTKGIIFDLDGVVVDTARFHFMAWKHIARKLAYPFSQQENERLKGISRVNSLEIILNLAKKELNQGEKEKLLVEKNEVYLTYINNLTRDDILPGISELLEQAKSMQIKTAIGSSSKNARHILEKLGLTSIFDAIVDGTDVVKSKPDPEVFAIGAEMLRVSNEECLVIEDAIAGIEAAQTIGMKTIGIGQSDELKLADYKFSSLSELSPQLLLKIVAA